MNPARGEPPALFAADIIAGLQHAVGATLPLAAAKNIELRTDLEQPALPLYFDRAQIVAVIVELLENAVRYTPRGGTVEIKGYSTRCAVRKFHLRSAGGVWFRPAAVSHEPNAYRVDFVDPGPAIPIEKLASVFDQYRAYSGSEDRSGTGLGLARCRMVLSAHCGEMFAEHQSAGATFSFVLPFVQPEVSEDEYIAAGNGSGALRDDFKNDTAGGGPS
jgi:signal transduction histidine kinase